MITQDLFLSAYEYQMGILYDTNWFYSLNERNDFIESVMIMARITLESKTTNWGVEYPAVKQTWKAIGGKGKPTLKMLRALPKK